MRPVVVDLGCAHRGEWFSLEALADEYKPKLIYGFDPSPLLDVKQRRAHGVPVRLERKAAWLHDGEVDFVDDFIRGGLPGPTGYGTTCPGADTSLGRIGTVVKKNGIRVPCFDFSRWLAGLGYPVILKMDVEGAEYPLLKRMIRDGTNRLVSELVMEWHEQPAPRLTKHFEKVRGWWM